MRNNPRGYLCALAMALALSSACGADSKIVSLLDPPAARNIPVAVMRANIVENGDWGDIYVLADGSASYDLEEKPLTYQWTLAEIPIGSKAALTAPVAMITQFQTDFNGCYTITLVVANSASIVSKPAIRRFRIIGAAGGGWEPRPNECSL
jgi:hypothetical protein